MTKTEKDALARAVEKRRRLELRLLERERRERAKELAEEAADRRYVDRLRAKLAELAVRADPALRRWIDERLDLALRAYPGARTRSLVVAELYITEAGPLLPSEPGDHHVARGRKSYTVAIGAKGLRFAWRASAAGVGGGAGDVKVRPRSFDELARTDLWRALGDAAEWQAPDVLQVAIRLARTCAAGELEALVLSRMA